MQNGTTLGVRLLHTRLVMLPIGLYTATLLGYLLFAMTQWMFCWHAALWMNVLGVATALSAAIPGARDGARLVATPGAPRGVVLGHAAIQCAALGLFAANLVVQQGAAALPTSVRMIASLVHIAKPDVTLALMFSGGGFVLTLLGAALGVVLSRSREKRMVDEGPFEAITTRLRAPLLP